MLYEVITRVLHVDDDQRSSPGIERVIGVKRTARWDVLPESQATITGRFLNFSIV